MGNEAFGLETLGKNRREKVDLLGRLYFFFFCIRYIVWDRLRSRKVIGNGFLHRDLSFLNLLKRIFSFDHA